MYNDKEFNNITKEERKFYIDDKIHPIKAIYLMLWTLYIESYLYKIVNKK